MVSNEAICQRLTGFIGLGLGLCGNQLSVIRKSCPRKIVKEVRTGRCHHGIYADASAVMGVPLVILLRYFRGFVKKLCAVRLTVFVISSFVFFGQVAAGGVYCAKTARGMSFNEQT